MPNPLEELDPGDTLLLAPWLERWRSRVCSHRRASLYSRALVARGTVQAAHEAPCRLRMAHAHAAAEEGWLAHRASLEEQGLFNQARSMG